MTKIENLLATTLGMLIGVVVLLLIFTLVSAVALIGVYLIAGWVLTFDDAFWLRAFGSALLMLVIALVRWRPTK